MFQELPSNRKITVYECYFKRGELGWYKFSLPSKDSGQYVSIENFKKSMKHFNKKWNTSTPETNPERFEEVVYIEVEIIENRKIVS